MLKAKTELKMPSAGLEAHWEASDEWLSAWPSLVYFTFTHCSSLSRLVNSFPLEFFYSQESGNGRLHSRDSWRPGMRHSIELRDLRSVGRLHRQAYTCAQCTVSAQAQSAQPASRKICVSPSLLTEELELETRVFKCLLELSVKMFKNTTPM